MTELEVIKTQLDKWFEELLRDAGDSGDATRAYGLLMQRYGLLLYEGQARRQEAHIEKLEEMVLAQTEAMQRIAQALESYWVY